MTQSKQKQKPLQQCIKDQDPICVNCRYYVNLVGVGFGIRCNQPQNRGDATMPPTIPSRCHSCQYFQVR
ncbi:hypothetical protein [Thalassotalea maritima]|uniref:hypothetical protein n=1 Tax=Thalassotalea maritima TaxID=3242416 RepID=UPI0035278558